MKLKNFLLLRMYQIPKNLEEIKDGITNNKLLLPVSMEGGEAIENNLNNLYHFIERGLLYFGPT